MDTKGICNIKYTVFLNVVEISNNMLELEDSDFSFYNFTMNHASLSINGKIYISKQGSGSVTFIENSDDNIKGTFEFTLYN
jgi:hypothetical protein